MRLCTNNGGFLCWPFFSTTYSIQFATARHRLQMGMPATVEHRVVHLGEPPSAVSVAECVHNYIGLIDTLKLNMWDKLYAFLVYVLINSLTFCVFGPFLWGKAPDNDFFPPPLEHCLNLYGRLGLIALWFLFGSWNWQLRIKLPHISQIFSPVFTKFGNSRQISQGQHLSDAGLSSWIKCARVMSLGKMRLDNYYMILRTRITLLCGCSGDMSNTFCSISLDVEKSSVFYHIQICPFKGM